MTVSNDAQYNDAVHANTTDGVIDWDGVMADLGEAQLDSADAQYLDGADGLDVQDDLEARQDLDDSAHDEVENDELATDLNTADATVAGGTVPVYTGGNIVSSDDYTVFTQAVFDAVQAGDTFETGGQVPPASAADGSDMSDHVDGLVLAEASKLTGEKHF